MDSTFHDFRRAITGDCHRRGRLGIRAASLGPAILSLLFLSQGPNLFAASITVFAAASLTDVLKEVGAGYEKSSSDKVLFNFAASSFLARQIIEGAPADVFFSADEAKMNDLEGQGLLMPGTRKAKLSNSLVIVVLRDGGVPITTPHDLTQDKVKRLALAETKTVPAGIYARAYLEQTRLWPRVEAKVIPTESVRGALAVVEAGNADAAIVYKTDAAISKKVQVACEIAMTNGPSIVYPVSVLKESSAPETGKRFLQYLDSAEASHLFQQFGFVVRN